ARPRVGLRRRRGVAPDPSEDVGVSKIAVLERDDDLVADLRDPVVPSVSPRPGRRDTRPTRLAAGDVRKSHLHATEVRGIADLSDDPAGCSDELLARLV